MSDIGRPLTSQQGMSTAMHLAENMPSIVDALISDLGESPEAIRGAQMVVESCRALMAGVVPVDAPLDERDSDAEMQAVGVVLALFARGVSTRCAELIDQPKPGIGGGFDS